MGAVNAVLLSQLRAGDHVIAQQCLYGGTFAMFADLAARYGIDVSYISGRDAAELDAARTPRSRLLYLETIANPTAAVSDLPGLLAAARQAGLTSVVDNTFATPMLCRPIELGADIVLHSATKYLGGHDDVTLGIIVAADPARFAPLWQHTTELGVAADPFAAWLHAARPEDPGPADGTALRHAAVPGPPAGRASRRGRRALAGTGGHPDHAVASRILSGFGGMPAFDLAGGRAAGLGVRRGAPGRRARAVPRRRRDPGPASRLDVAPAVRPRPAGRGRNHRGQHPGLGRPGASR